MPEITHGRIRTTSTRHKRTECHSLSFKRKQLMRPSAVYCSPRQSLRWELTLHSSSDILMNALLSWQLDSHLCVSVILIFSSPAWLSRKVKIKFPLSVPEQRLSVSDKDTFPLVLLKSSLFLSVYLFFQNYNASSDSIDLALIPIAQLLDLLGIL